MPYRTAPAPYRTVPCLALQTGSPANRDCLLLLLLSTATTRPGEGVSDYKEGCSRPESAQGKTSPHFGNFASAPSKFCQITLLAATPSKVIKRVPSVFLPLRNLVLDTTPHCAHTQHPPRTHAHRLSHTRTNSSATSSHPQPSIDRNSQTSLDHAQLNFGACSIPLSCAAKCGIQTTLGTTSTTFATAVATTSASQVV